MLIIGIRKTYRRVIDPDAMNIKSSVSTDQPAEIIILVKQFRACIFKIINCFSLGKNYQKLDRLKAVNMPSLENDLKYLFVNSENNGA